VVDAVGRAVHSELIGNLAYSLYLRS
jgi:hypothetical protein